MVKLSDIIRKSSEDKLADKPGAMSEALKAKVEQASLPEVKKIYEDAILRLRLIMDDLREGKAVEGSEVISIAEVLLEKLRTSNNMIVSLMNIFAFYGEKEKFLHSHSVNSAILATNIGLNLGYDENELIDLCASTLLHDIGLLEIPPEILNKSEKLTEEEYALFRMHPVYGLEFLKNIKKFPKSSPEVVYQHHERVDGSGYPEGKKGDDISDYAKLVAIVEVYEDVTHPRPYRRKKNIPYEGVKLIIEKERDTFDPKFVKVFFNIVTPYPLGSFVLLNSNEIGRVIAINKNLPLRPVVQIFYDAGGKPPKNPKIIDLAKAPVLYVERAVDESEL